MSNKIRLIADKIEDIFGNKVLSINNEELYYIDSDELGGLVGPFNGRLIDFGTEMLLMENNKHYSLFMGNKLIGEYAFNDLREIARNVVKHIPEDYDGIDWGQNSGEVTIWIEVNKRPPAFGELFTQIRVGHRADNTLRRFSEVQGLYDENRKEWVIEPDYCEITYDGKMTSAGIAHSVDVIKVSTPDRTYFLGAGRKIVKQIDRKGFEVYV